MSRSTLDPVTLRYVSHGVKGSSYPKVASMILTLTGGLRSPSDTFSRYIRGTALSKHRVSTPKCFYRGWLINSLGRRGLFRYIFFTSVHVSNSRSFLSIIL